MQFKLSLLFQSIFVVLLILTALLGDFLVSVSRTHLQKAVVDNSTHALIAGVSWLIVSFRLSDHQSFLLEVVLCSVLGSLIDLDHFYKARSLNLKAATDLKGRPPLHCTTVPLAIWLCLFGLGRCYGWRMAQRLSFLVLTAFLSHHVRDATRRGFWVYPFGSTTPISRYTYIGSTCFVPFVIAWSMDYLQLRKHTLLSYESDVFDV